MRVNTNPKENMLSFMLLTPPSGTTLDHARRTVRDLVHSTNTPGVNHVEVSTDTLPAGTPPDSPDWFVVDFEIDGADYRMVFERIFAPTEVS